MSPHQNPEQTIRTSRSGKIAAAVRDRRHEKATAKTQPLIVTRVSHSELAAAEREQDAARRDGYEILMDLVDTVGWKAIETALVRAGEEANDWRTQVDETRAAHKAADVVIARAASGVR